MMLGQAGRHGHSARCRAIPTLNVLSCAPKHWPSRPEHGMRLAPGWTEALGLFPPSLSPQSPGDRPHAPCLRLVPRGCLTPGSFPASLRSGPSQEQQRDIFSLFTPTEQYILVQLAASSANMSGHSQGRSCQCPGSSVTAVCLGRCWHWGRKGNQEGTRAGRGQQVGASWPALAPTYQGSHRKTSQCYLLFSLYLGFGD